MRRTILISLAMFSLILATLACGSSAGSPRNTTQPRSTIRPTTTPSGTTNHFDAWAGAKSLLLGVLPNSQGVSFCRVAEATINESMAAGAGPDYWVVLGEYERDHKTYRFRVEFHLRGGNVWRATHILVRDAHGVFLRLPG